MESTPSQIFSQRVKELRKKLGLTQYTLAHSVGINPAHLRKIENRKGGHNSRIDTVFRFAKALNVTPHYLLGLDLISFSESIDEGIR